MDWTIFTSPLAGLLGVLVGTAISSSTTRRTHKERIAADQALAERKIAADIDLAERKFKFDSDLAERKFHYDRAFNDHKRRVDLAEQAIAAFYEARDVLDFSRSRFLGAGEGKSRPKVEGESEKVRERRELYFIPIERINTENALFARLLAMRYSFAAHFGQDAAGPFNAILQARNEIISAASILIQTVSEFGQDSIEMRNVLGWGPAERPNKLDREIADAVAAIEEICRPVLSQQPPS
jgi:hypothetical protein